MAQSLAWARDFFIFASQHPEEIQRLRDRLEASDRAKLATRTAIAPGAITEPAGGTVISFLDHVKPQR